jgi:uncharacterized coiled-coil DUF342 family protein
MPNPEIVLLELATEIGELRLQLAEAQEQCIELAVDAGQLHAEIRELRRELVATRWERDGYRERLRSRGGARSAA